MAWYVVARDVCGVVYTVEQSALLDEWAELMQATGWWFSFADFVVMCERHRHLHFDEQRRLHCSSGPAIECRDGYRVYAWHGTRVPAKWIDTPGSIDPSLALTWKNIEQRRCLAEIIGWQRVLDQLSPTVIDEDTPEIGRLLQVDLPDSAGERFLEVRCGTGRTFVLPVPPYMTTARQANAWTYGLEAFQLQGEVRT